MLKSVRIVVKEWARRHAVPDAATRAFISEVHADAVCVQSSQWLFYFGRSEQRHYAPAQLQLHAEWELLGPIASMAQKVLYSEGNSGGNNPKSLAWV